jgi:hypothetical protein
MPHEPSRTTERIRTEGRKDRKGVGTDWQSQSEYHEGPQCPRLVFRTRVFATFVFFCERFHLSRMPREPLAPRNESAQKAAKIAKGLAPICRARSKNTTKVLNAPAGFSHSCLCDLRVLL